jgi:hypothetical protein
MPPRVRQPIHTQHPYIAQEIVITPAGIIGAPLILPFEALFDRTPQANEGDILFTQPALGHFTRNM